MKHVQATRGFNTAKPPHVIGESPRAWRRVPGGARPCRPQQRGRSKSLFEMGGAGNLPASVGPSSVAVLRRVDNVSTGTAAGAALKSSARIVRLRRTRCVRQVAGRNRLV